MKTHRLGPACDFDPRGANENSSPRLDVTRRCGGRAAGGNGLCCGPVEVASLVESHCELREALPSCERSGLATQNSPRYSLAVSTGWNNPLAICILEQRKESFLLCLNVTAVFQLHALFQKSSTHLRSTSKSSVTSSRSSGTDTRWSALKGTSVLLGPSSP